MFFKNYVSKVTEELVKTFRNTTSKSSFQQEVVFCVKFPVTQLIPLYFYYID